jgi:formylmethanofuran dehydrogenase subunit A
LHLHGNNIGNPGNVGSTIDTLKLAKGYSPKGPFGRDQVMHNTHLQFFCYNGTSWGDMKSGSKEVMDYVNSVDNITVDLGAVTLDETTTMTADGPFEHHLTSLNHLKWANVDVELETSSGVVPFIYDKDSKVSAIQWAVGLELALYAKDPMRVHITTDHPNGGPFTRYPRIIKWLMSAKAREATLDTMKYKDKVIDATYISSLDRELSLYEIAMMTRAGTAKALGFLDMYGSLKEGTNANISIFDIDPASLPSDPECIEAAFQNAAYTVKDGVVVVENGQIVAEPEKHFLWTDVKMAENPQVMHDLVEKFQMSYTVNLGNYAIFDEHVHNPKAIQVEVP